MSAKGTIIKMKIAYCLAVAIKRGEKKKRKNGRKKCNVWRSHSIKKTALALQEKKMGEKK